MVKINMNMARGQKVSDTKLIIPVTNCIKPSRHYDEIKQDNLLLHLYGFKKSDSRHVSVYYNRTIQEVCSGILDSEL